MADGILTPCNYVTRSWHWFRQVTAPCNVACGSGTVTVNSPYNVFKLADGRHVRKYWNAITRLPMDRLERNLGGRMLSRSRHVRHDAVAMATGVAWHRRIEHSAVMGVWRPNACDSREPILMKFGTQQQVKTAMTVAWSNIKIFKIQDGGGPSCWKNIGNAITRLPMDQLGRNLGGQKKLFRWYWSLLLTA